MTTSPACRTAACSSTGSTARSPCRAPRKFVRPTVIVLDFDRFKQINESVGLPSRRFHPPRHGPPSRAGAEAARHAGPRHRRPVRTAAAVRARARTGSRMLADTVRRALTAPVVFGEREIFLTASIGIALPDRTIQSSGRTSCETPRSRCIHSKRQGGDRIEVFRSAMRAQRTDRLAVEMRPAAGARARRDQDPVPADRAAGGPDHRRVRGAGALGPSQARPHAAAASSSASPRKAG